ncbi:unnamed protein product, partial [Cladocopium goreaui]
AKRAIRLWGQGLELAGEEFRVRVAKSTRSQKGPGKGAGKGEAEELAASTHDKGEEPDVVCLLCGDASHVLKSCKFQSRGLRISCSALEGKTLEEAKEEVSQTFKVLDAALVPDKARWHGLHLRTGESALWLYPPFARKTLAHDFGKVNTCLQQSFFHQCGYLLLGPPFHVPIGI